MSRIETVITYLQMLALPDRRTVPAPRGDLQVIRAQRPTVAFYRFLYDRVGAPWLWCDRRRMSDLELAAIVQHPDVEVHVLHAGGVPAGYVELDRRVPPDIELAYFGLMPEFIGQKLGPHLLDWAIRTAWSYSPARLWVHTQTLDHPSALPLYRELGFVSYRQERLMIDVALPG
jgi:GNAT superfamily N-acetyltransferase